MKTCPYCAEEIQDAAIVCKHCGRDLVVATQRPTTPPPAAAPQKKSNSAAIGCAAVLGLFLLFVGMCSSFMPDSSPTRTVGSTSATVTPQPVRDTQPALALLSSRGGPTAGGNFYEVRGQVKNIGEASLQNVAVMVTWYTKDDQFITSDDTLIDFNPILPNQTSPFHNLARGNPAMSKYTVEFKRLFGPAIPHRDDRK